MRLIRVAQLALALNGLAFLGFGLIFAVDPDGMMASLDLEISSGVARTDLRAIYGGLEVGLGLWLLLACARPSLHTAGLISGALVTGGLVCGRGLGMLLDGADPLNPTLIASEFAAFLLCAVALVLTRGVRTP